MVRAVPPGRSQIGELVLDHPVEVAGLDALRPLALGRHVVTSSSQVSDLGASPRLCASRRARSTPADHEGGTGVWHDIVGADHVDALAIAQVAVASDASRRSSVGWDRGRRTPGDRGSTRRCVRCRTPIVDFRLVPTTYGPARGDEPVESPEQREVVGRGSSRTRARDRSIPHRHRSAERRVARSCQELDGPRPRHRRSAGRPAWWPARRPCASRSSRRHGRRRPPTARRSRR